MTHSPKNIAGSVRQRLLNLAKSRGEEFERLLVRFGLERLLYRLSRSPHADQFVLKGAMLFTAWEGAPHRMTRDLDLLGRGESSQERIRRVFRDVCEMDAPEDGFKFLAKSVTSQEIRGMQEYGGVRVTLEANLSGAVFRLQVDVGFGDAVTPKSILLAFPTLLDMPQPMLQAYTPETVVAEKVEAMVRLDMTNTRMKDYFDLRHLARHQHFQGHVLRDALRATFNRRNTDLPLDAPPGLSDRFAQNALKQTQWQAFYRRIGRFDEPLALPDVVTQVRQFVLPPLQAAAGTGDFQAIWKPGGPWNNRNS